MHDPSLGAILYQKPFRHVAAGVDRYIVVMVVQDSACYRVNSIDSPLGIDGLPDFAKGVLMAESYGTSTFEMAQVYLDDVIKKRGSRWVLVTRDEAFDFNDARMENGASPLYDYRFEASEIARAREHLRDHMHLNSVSSFLASLAGKDPAHEWTLRVGTHFLPVLISVALAGIGVLSREGERLTEGQLCAMARYAQGDSWTEPAFRALGLRRGDGTLPRRLA